MVQINLIWVPSLLTSTGNDATATAKATSVVSDSVRSHRQQPTRLSCPWDSPGKNTGVGCHFLLQRIFPTQGSNPGLTHCRQMLYRLSHQGSKTQETVFITTSLTIVENNKITLWLLGGWLCSLLSLIVCSSTLGFYFWLIQYYS